MILPYINTKSYFYLDFICHYFHNIQNKLISSKYFYEEFIMNVI